jgi:hypothetical protein
LRARPRSAAANGATSVFVFMSTGPRPICGNSSARLNQKMIWTSSGVPRKNQVCLNTLRQRLARIEGLSGRSLSSMDARVDLFLALRTRALR